ncbi:MAG: phospho-N-acetylmuramoyl-pentapeptide-transferase [Methanosarcinales archaeon]|nr:phospho-N-acetylmuramoyl-pentapeptide-transferase [Methanosarcinales archaeon]
MIYELLNTLSKSFDFPGAYLFNFLSFRASLSAATALIITILFGKKIIDKLRSLQVGESVRDLGLAGQKEKEGTPTMGGLMILGAILLPTLLFADLKNIYIQMMILTTVWMGIIGFIDDYIKIFKRNKKGLPGKFKVFGQISLGIIIGSIMYFHSDIYVKKEIAENEVNRFSQEQISTVKSFDGRKHYMAKIDAPITTIPFIKGQQINYEKPVVMIFGENARPYAWIFFIGVIIFIITAISNGANLTDGIDGLATGTSAIMGVVLFALVYISGNIIFANYLNIMYIPHIGELVVFVAAFVGATIGFLWYNSFPAKVFMGDTGSLAIGGIIASLAIITRKEWMLPLLAGIFLVENLSVVMQVGWFKYTKKKYGEGRRIFLMSPLHHHYQKIGYHESKIVTRFFIVGILLAILTVATLKMR